MGVYIYTPIFSIMALNKLKRGEDWVDKDLFNNNVNTYWNDYLTDYDFGKNIDFNKMNEMLNYMLTGINNGNIIYNPTTGNTYSFTINGNKPEWDPTSPEARFTVGFIGKYLREAAALKEDPWNANTYYSDLLKLKYWKGQEANNDLLLALPQDLKISTYKNMIDIFKSGIDGIPEDLREDYLNFWNRASGFMDNGLIDPNELNDLYRYTGLTFNWLRTPEPKVEKIIDTPVPSTKVKQEQPTLISEPKKPSYDYHTDVFLDENDFDEEVANQVMAMSDVEFKKQLNLALSNPELSKDILPYFIIRKLETTNSKENYLDLESISTSGYKFFFDRKKNQVVKSHKSNFAVHENVETPKPTDKEETKPETKA